MLEYDKFTDPRSWHVINVNAGQNEHILKGYTIFIGGGRIQLNHFKDEKFTDHITFRHAMEAAYSHYWEKR
jgi:hypothetical protein